MGYRVATTTHHATVGPNEALLSLRGMRSGVCTVIVQQGNKRTARPLILVPYAAYLLGRTVRMRLCPM